MDNINDKLNTLSESERKIALEILKQYGEQGKSDLYDTLKYADYDEIPVDINTFLHDKKYLGNALYDQEGKFTLFPYWEEKLKEIFPTNITTKYNTIVFTGAIGLGKAQPLYSKLLTEDGFKAMGDITLSDKIYGKDGKLHSIIGIFPQGKKKTYRITFKDGTHTDCADNHLWTIYDKRYNYREETLTTEDIIKNKPIFKMNKQGFKERLLSIPLCEPVQFDKKDLFIDPYVLGVLLGDGGLSCGSVNITSSDIEIFNYVETAINEKGYTLSEQISLSRRIIKKDKNLHNNQYNHNPNKYFQEIKKLKLDTTSSEKFIPDIYKYSSVEDRTALLQGLMDTDGTINKTGSIIQFNTISKKLAEDFAFIVRSLGGIITSIRWISAKYKNKQGETISCKPSCTVSFKLPKNICPFRLSRKAARINPRATAPRKLIENIQYIGEEDCQCICTDASDHLYITDDFLVTHNSTIAVICLLYMLYRLLCLKDPYLYYGLQPIDKITISLMNITLENAKGVALDKMNQMILSSEWFMSHGKMTGTSNLEFVPEKHIELITASSNNQVIGRAVFCLDGESVIKTDIGDFCIKDLVGKQFRVYNVSPEGLVSLSDICSAKKTLETAEYYNIVLENQTVLRCTYGHRFLLKDYTYKEVQNLTTEDELLDLSSFENYDLFISNIIKTRGQWNIPDNEYFEGHHIIPKCMGGTGNTHKKDKNIIWLYPEEHFIAHKLLVEKYPDNAKLNFAFSRMLYGNYGYLLSACDYANYKNKYREILASRKISEKTKSLMSIAQQHRYANNHGTVYNKRAINNGVICKYIDKNTCLPPGWKWGNLTYGKHPKHTIHKKHIIKDPISFKKQKSDQVSGMNNPMYKKGYKIAGGKNGRALKDYWYKDKYFDCRKNLVSYLVNSHIDKTLTTSNLQIYERNKSALILKRHPCLETVYWRFKDENITS